MWEEGNGLGVPRHDQGRVLGSVLLSFLLATKRGNIKKGSKKGSSSFYLISAILKCFYRTVTSLKISLNALPHNHPSSMGFEISYKTNLTSSTGLITAAPVGITVGATETVTYDELVDLVGSVDPS